MSSNGTMTVGEMLSQLRNTPIAVPGATNGGTDVSGDDALAVWAKNYANSEEGKRVSALIDVRLREVHALIAEQSFSDEALDALAKGVGDAITRAVAPLKARIAELEATAVKYSGVWDPEKAYSAGTLVTFQGGMWHCEDKNCGVRPGSGSTTWTLANKSRR